MSDVIKKRFKCVLCKHKYPVTSDMLKTIKNRRGIHDYALNRGFKCPVCGLVYIFDTDGFGGYKWYPAVEECVEI